MMLAQKKILQRNQLDQKNPLNKNSASSKQNILLKFYEKYMLLIGIGGQSLFYLQAFKIFLNGSAHDVSLSGFVMASISLMSWLIYGIILKNYVLIIVNVIAVLGAILTLFAIFWVS